MLNRVFLIHKIEREETKRGFKYSPISPKKEESSAAFVLLGLKKIALTWKKQPIMPFEDRLFDRELMRSAMASSKSKNIYISICFMAVRNCINVFVLC